jgi:dTDP-glucose pyrophosphorylase
VNEPIRKAVLLAAGRGKRLGALTEHFPKPLLEVGGQPILHRILAGLAGAGVTDLAINTGHEAERLEDATGDGGRFGLKISYVRQPVPTGTARALALAREFVDRERFFVGWGDIVVGPENYANVVSAAARARAVLAVNHVDDPASGGAVYVDEAMRVTRLVEKPPPGASATSWNNAGLMVLPPEIWRFCDGLQPSPRGEYELPQAIGEMVEAGIETLAVPIEGPWFDIGTPENLAAARQHFG